VIDLHSHILPGLDDGSANLEESLEMCRIAVNNGITTITATPHMLNERFNVSKEKIFEEIARLVDILKTEKIPLNIEPGSEVRLNADLLPFLDEDRAMTMGNAGRYILLELPGEILPHGLDKYLFSVQLTGLIPIIAHPERNFEVQSHPEVLEQFVSSGTLLQITAGSLTGLFGSRVQKCATWLLKSNMAHLVGSDAHSADYRTPVLKAAYNLVKRKKGNDEAQNVFITRPEIILAGETIDTPEIKRSRGPFTFLRRLRSGGQN